MRGLTKGFSKKWTVAILAVAMMSMLSGCGSSSYDNAASMEAITMNSAKAEAGASKQYVTEEAAMEMADAGSFTSGSTMETGSAPEVSATDRKLIKTVDMNVETQSFDQLLTTIESQVAELGGYIESMNTYNGSSYYNYDPIRNADMTIRIPKDKLNGFLNTVAGISNVVRKSENVEDVTLTYVDLQSHKETLRTEQGRLLELLEKAESIEDIITIEQRLSDVRYQLESMESQLRTFDNQVDYSTVYLSIDEVEIFTPVEEETVWERISGGFMESLDNIGEGFVEFGIWFVIHIPYMVVWIVVILVLVFVICRLVKHSDRSKSKRAAQSTAGQIEPQQEPKK